LLDDDAVEGSEEVVQEGESVSMQIKRKIVKGGCDSTHDHEENGELDTCTRRPFLKPFHGEGTRLRTIGGRLVEHDVLQDHGHRDRKSPEDSEHGQVERLCPSEASDLGSLNGLHLAG